MQLHELQVDTPRKHGKRVGRGGKRGKTAGRGTKGQKARSGHRMRPQLRDIIKKLPKRRGYGKNRARGVHSGRIRPTVVNVGIVSRTMSLTGTVKPEALVAAGLVRPRGGTVPPVKILGMGAIDRKLHFSGLVVSKSAKEKIEKAGGTVDADVRP